MKKALLVFAIGLLVLVASSTAFAATSEQPSAPEPSEQELYQQMYEACHGPNGYMTKYYNKDVTPSGYGMMGNSGMMGVNNEGMEV